MVVKQDLIDKYDSIIELLEEELMKMDMPPPPPAMHAESTVKTPNVPPPKEILAAIESTSHTQRKHPVVKVGVNKGTYSHSSYGLMPIDVLETAHKHPPFKNSDLGKQILGVKSVHDINKITYDQKKDDEILNHVWDYKQSRLKANHIVNPEHLELLGVLAHRRGVSGALKQWSEGGLEGIKNDPYVKKYLELKNNPKTIVSEKEIKNKE